MKVKNIPKHAKKFGEWVFKKPEKKLIAWLLPRIPKQIETYHLTYLTLGWMIVVVAGGYLSQKNLNYLWLISLGIAGQYLTDLLDGALGRLRKTGLVRWGFYMDHFLDFGFLSSILIGYWFVTPDNFRYIILATLILSTGYFVHTILYFGATGEFETSSMGIGPTEMRLVLVIINSMLALFNRVIFVGFLLLYFLSTAIYLLVTIYIMQKKLWAMDMKNRK